MLRYVARCFRDCREGAAHDSPTRTRAPALGRLEDGLDVGRVRLCQRPPLVQQLQVLDGPQEVVGLPVSDMQFVLQCLLELAVGLDALPRASGVRQPLKAQGPQVVGAGVQQGKGKGKVLGRSPNSSVSVIPTCPSQHPFRLAGSQTP